MPAEPPLGSAPRPTEFLLPMDHPAAAPLRAWAEYLGALLATAEHAVARADASLAEHPNPTGDGRLVSAMPGDRLPFLNSTSCDPDRSLVAWTLYLEVLVGAAERALGAGHEARERAQLDLVWFLRSTPSSAGELDRLANLAIAALDDSDGAAVAELHGCRRSVAVFAYGAWSALVGARATP